MDLNKETIDYGVVQLQSVQEEQTQIQLDGRVASTQASQLYQICCSIPLWTPLLLLKINSKQPEKSSAEAKWRLQVTNFKAKTKVHYRFLLDAKLRPTRPGIPALETSLPETCWIHVVVQQKGMPVACREMLCHLLGLSAMSPFFCLFAKGTWINDASIYCEYCTYCIDSNYPSPASAASVSLSFGLKWMNSQVMLVEREDLISRLRIRRFH